MFFSLIFSLRVSRLKFPLHLSSPPARTYSRCQGAQIFHESKSNLKILDARRLTWNKFQIQNPHIWGATVKNVVVRATWRPRFVHPCPLLNPDHTNCVIFTLYYGKKNSNLINKPTDTMWRFKVVNVQIEFEYTHTSCEFSSWLWTRAFVCGFPTPSRQTLQQYLKTGHGHLLSHPRHHLS
jgi:hypothetical protein